MKRSIRLLAAAGIAGIGLSSSAIADIDVYAAKVVCYQAGSYSSMVASGYYRTVVNIYNPSYEQRVEIAKKFSRAVPERREWSPEALSEEHYHVLAPMQTMSVDCTDIPKLYPQSPGTQFLEGMLVVMTRAPFGIDPPPLVVKTVMTVEKRLINGDDIQTHTVTESTPVRIIEGDPPGTD